MQVIKTTKALSQLFSPQSQMNYLGQAKNIATLYIEYITLIAIENLTILRYCLMFLCDRQKSCDQHVISLEEHES